MKRKINPTLQDKVNEIIVDHLHCELAELTPHTRLNEDLNADYLDVVELVMLLEEEFGIEISDGDAEKLLTVKSLYDYVEDHAEVSVA